MAWLLGILFAALLVTAQAFAGELAPSVRAWMSEGGPDDEIAVWVYLRDKGPMTAADLERGLAEIAGTYMPRAVERRLRARPIRPFDITDLPVHKPYVTALESEGVEFRAFSRWVNAVSIEATSSQIEDIAALDFVTRISRVSGRLGGPRPETIKVRKPLRTLDQYGSSYAQLAQIQVTDLHAESLSGDGVVLAIFDTGFWLEHESLGDVNVLAEHDFINDDGVTANEPGDDPIQHNHGTMCLSLLAGNTPGVLLGAARGAEYLLAKTEDMTMEEPVEEDYWIEAAEWADSLGADIISSSLCYNDWYTYEDMDGETAPITIAADQAAVNGIAVVNAAGNSGSSEWTYILAPADGDSVITAGAVDSTGARAYFSSLGPTYDGRIKPTIMAMGMDNYIADPLDAYGYRRGNGTSFACPLVAGAIALILEKNPSWASPEIIEAITATGTQSSAPDTLYGWGILRAYAASEYDPNAGLADAHRAPVLMVYPNPCTSRLDIQYQGGEPLPKAYLYDVRGRLLETLVPLGPGGITLDLRNLTPPLSPGIVFIVAPGVTPAKVVVVK
jgi:hypothetical protein